MFSKKKKRSSPKFGLLFFAVPHRHLSKFPDFAQIFRIAARKIMVLPKYFLLTARKILILPKSSKLGEAIALPAPPADTAMLSTVKKRWLTDMPENLFFVFVVESFYYAINSSAVSSLLIMLIRSISRSSSLKIFYLLSHTIDILTKACSVNFFVFVYPYQWVLYFIHPQRYLIQK